MARIDYAISVTPIQASQYDVTYDSAEAGTNTTNTDIDYVDPEIGRSLGGGNSSFAWAGDPIDDWSAAAVHTHKEAWTTAQTVGASGDNMIWIKHTGKLFDSGTASSTVNILSVSVLIERTVTIAEMNTTGVQLADGDGNVTLTSGTAVVYVEIGRLLTGEAMVITLPQGTIKIKSTVTTSQGAGPAVEYAKLT